MQEDLLKQSVMSGLVLLVVWLVIAMLTKNMKLGNVQNKQYLQVFLSGAVLHLVLCQLNGSR